MSVVVLLFLSLVVRSSVAENKVSHRDCVVTPWFDFSENCKTGYTVQLRYVVNHSVGNGRQCPKLIMIKPCDRTQSMNKKSDSYSDSSHINKYLGHHEIHQDLVNYGYYGNYGYGDYHEVGNYGYYHTDNSGNYNDYGSIGYNGY